MLMKVMAVQRPMFYVKVRDLTRTAVFLTTDTLEFNVCLAEMRPRWVPEDSLYIDLSGIKHVEEGAFGAILRLKSDLYKDHQFPGMVIVKVPNKRIESKLSLLGIGPETGYRVEQ